MAAADTKIGATAVAGPSGGGDTKVEMVAVLAVAEGAMVPMPPLEPPAESASNAEAAEGIRPHAPSAEKMIGEQARSTSAVAARGDNI